MIKKLLYNEKNYNLLATLELKEERLKDLCFHINYIYYYALTLITNYIILNI
jgi:hypothetical protein